jgi:hypothetical protein
MTWQEIWIVTFFYKSLQHQNQSGPVVPLAEVITDGNGPDARAKYSNLCVSCPFRRPWATPVTSKLLLLSRIKVRILYGGRLGSLIIALGLFNPFPPKSFFSSDQKSISIKTAATAARNLQFEVLYESNEAVERPQQPPLMSVCEPVLKSHHTHTHKRAGNGVVLLFFSLSQRSV